MKISTHEPVTQLRRVPIVECGEPLVDFLALCSALVWDKPRWRYERLHLLRESAAERLCKAASALPDGYRLAVIEGWRPPHIQRRMWLAAYHRWKENRPSWSETALRRFANRFTAPLNRWVPPPHTTGGAMDVLLVDEGGAALDHSSPYGWRDPSSFPFDAPKLSQEAALHRRILREALFSAGITNYPSEYWHYSYGDQGWAYREGRPRAIYGAVEPAGYAPRPEEDVDEPLEWAEPI